MAPVGLPWSGRSESTWQCPPVADVLSFLWPGLSLDNFQRNWKKHMYSHIHTHNMRTHKGTCTRIHSDTQHAHLHIHTHLRECTHICIGRCTPPATCTNSSRYISTHIHPQFTCTLICTSTCTQSHTHITHTLTNTLMQSNPSTYVVTPAHPQTPTHMHGICTHIHTHRYIHAHTPTHMRIPLTSSMEAGYRLWYKTGRQHPV